MAFLAGILYRLAGAVTAWAGRLIHDLSKRGILYLLAHACTVTIGTGRDIRSAFTVAVRARLCTLVADFNFLSKRRFLEGYGQFITQIAAALGTRRTAVRSTAAAKEHVKDIVETTAATAKAAAKTAKTAEAGAGTTAAAHAALKSSMTKLVVRLFLFRVFENFVCLVNFLKFFLSGLRVIAVEIWMIFSRHLLIGSLDLSIRRALLDAEDFIVIAFFAHIAPPVSVKPCYPSLP